MRSVSLIFKLARPVNLNFTPKAQQATLKMVGIVLAISLLTIPQMTANLFTYNYRQMIWASIILGWIDCIAGLYISYLLNVPSGATIIFISIVVFALAKIVLGIRRKMPDKQ